MNTPYFREVQRRDFGDMLSVDGVARLSPEPAGDLQSLLERWYPPAQSVLAVWAEDPKLRSSLPHLLVCQDGEESDWAAWITTFGAKIRPFSSFMRLIGRSECANLLIGQRTPVLDRVTWPVSGLILGEVLAASRLPDKSLETMPANACESTLSFAMFRAAAAYSSFQRWNELVKAWESVRQAARQQSRLIDSPAVARVCAVIITAANLGDPHVLIRPNDITLVQACREILRSPELIPGPLFFMPVAAFMKDTMRGPREERVIAFSELVRSIEKVTSGDRELTSFMLGYFASRIAPGTMQHSAVLTPLHHTYPTALLWYGFCAGLGGSEFDSEKVSSGKRFALELPASARRVARDLLRPERILDSPTSDIGVFELLALARTAEDPLAGLVRSTQGTATVELAPSVWTVVNVSSKFGADEVSRTARDREIIASMGVYIDRLRDAYRILTGSDLGDTEQRPLFPPKRKKS